VRAATVTLAGILLLGACSSHQRPPVAAPAPTREGRTSVRVLEDEAEKPPGPNAPSTMITAAMASSENAPPRYPAQALRAGCDRGVVASRVFVDKDGNVARIDMVPGRISPHDRCHLAFWGAVTDAVRTWRFSPSFRLTPKPGPDIDGDGQPDLTEWDQTPIAIYLDFEFTFRVVEGRGEASTR